MNFRIYILAIFSFFISGCAVTNLLTPTNNIEGNVTKDNNITIVESIDTASAEHTIISPIEENKIIVKDKKYNLKPEPFSLDSNEDDPELLGPQSTTDKVLDRLENIGDAKKQSKSKSTKDKEKSKKV